MALYKKLIRSALFNFASEEAHDLTLNGLAFASNHPFLLAVMREMFYIDDHRLSREFMGIQFPNMLGLAAGMDKNARAIPAWAALGFGFVEIGTVTPRPQIGNPKPRMFRLSADEAIINRMGFNNDGAVAIAERLKGWGKQSIIIGVSVGKQKETQLEDTADDHDVCLELLYEYGDYFVINISSPNTLGLRQLQGKDFLLALLTRARSKMDCLNETSGKRKPILVKIAPDLSSEELLEILGALLEAGMDGVIATNTTIKREGLITKIEEAGGLSGPSLTQRADLMVETIRRYAPRLPIIGVGGIHNGHTASSRLRKGADLIQLYTALVYEGPSLPRRIKQYLLDTYGLW